MRNYIAESGPWPSNASRFYLPVAQNAHTHTQNAQSVFHPKFTFPAKWPGLSLSRSFSLKASSFLSQSLSWFYPFPQNLLKFFDTPAKPEQNGKKSRERKKYWTWTTKRRLKDPKSPFMLDFWQFSDEKTTQTVIAYKIPYNYGCLAGLPVFFAWSTRLHATRTCVLIRIICVRSRRHTVRLYFSAHFFQLVFFLNRRFFFLLIDFVASKQHCKCLWRQFPFGPLCANCVGTEASLMIANSFSPVSSVHFSIISMVSIVPLNWWEKTFRTT